MPFDPTQPQNGEVVDADVLRGQLNALNDQLVAAKAALDWSNGAPKLPDYSTIANPVTGNIAFDYANQRTGVYINGEWVWIG